MNSTSCPLDWIERTKDMTDEGKSSLRSANPAEREAIARALIILACDSLDADYSIRRLSQGRYRLDGVLRASVTQTCVITLDPVPEKIEEAFEVEFWPPEMLEARAPSGEKGVLDGADVEPLAKNAIDVGRIVFELLSASLEPYPRKAGAAFEWSGSEADAIETKPDSPFSVLDKLRPKE